VGYRAGLWNLRTIYKLKMPPKLREEMTKQLLLKNREKQIGETLQPPDKMKT
jgi:hypothetical protein